MSDMQWSTKMLSLTASQSAVFLPAASAVCCLLFPISLDPLSDGHDHGSFKILPFPNQ